MKYNRGHDDEHHLSRRVSSPSRRTRPFAGEGNRPAARDGGCGGSPPRAAPGGLVPEDYVFEGLGADGAPARIKLSQLFAPGKDSLVVYNFMFPRYPKDDRPGPAEGATARLKREEGPCPSCTAFIDSLDGAAEHVEQHVNFVVIAKAPLDRLIAFGRDRGWRRLRLLSAAGNTFKRDYHAETPEGFQMPMMTVFHRHGDEIRHFWSSEMFYAPIESGQDPRHTGTIEPLWNIFDLTREGRPSNWQEQLTYGRTAHTPARVAG